MNVYIYIYIYKERERERYTSERLPASLRIDRAAFERRPPNRFLCSRPWYVVYYYFYHTPSNAFPLRNRGHLTELAHGREVYYIIICYPIICYNIVHYNCVYMYNHYIIYYGSIYIYIYILRPPDQTRPWTWGLLGRGSELHPGAHVLFLSLRFILLLLLLIIIIII